MALGKLEAKSKNCSTHDYTQHQNYKGLAYF